MTSGVIWRSLIDWLEWRLVLSLYPCSLSHGSDQYFLRSFSVYIILKLCSELNYFDLSCSWKKRSTCKPPNTNSILSFINIITYCIGSLYSGWVYMEAIGFGFDCSVWHRTLVVSINSQGVIFNVPCVHWRIIVVLEMCVKLCFWDVHLTAIYKNDRLYHFYSLCYILHVFFENAVIYNKIEIRPWVSKNIIWNIYIHKGKTIYHSEFRNFREIYIFLFSVESSIYLTYIVRSVFSTCSHDEPH